MNYYKVNLLTIYKTECTYIIRVKDYTVSVKQNGKWKSVFILSPENRRRVIKAVMGQDKQIAKGN